MIVAVAPEFSVRRKMSVQGAMKPEMMHVTVLYIEDMFMTPEQFYVINNALHEVSNNLVEFEVRAAELSRFEKVMRAWDEKGGYIPAEPTDAIIYKLESDDLHKLRDGIIALFDAYEIPYSKKFKDFKPHITVGYVPHGQDLECPVELPFTFSVKHVELWDDSAHTLYPLRKKE